MKQREKNERTAIYHIFVTPPPPGLVFEGFGRIRFTTQIVSWLLNFVNASIAHQLRIQPGRLHKSKTADNYNDHLTSSVIPHVFSNEFEPSVCPARF